ncbi:MAG: rubredoxin [Clostridia bacterium]|nr:rubredoxin [Clostridia bacterium]
MKLWRCGVCGYVHDGDTPPEKCPKCGAPREKFSEIPQADADMIRRSRFTNDLHCKLITLMEEVGRLANAGIEDNLDPPCVGVFKLAKEQAWIIGQASKAEIRGHIGKSKWS